MHQFHWENLFSVKPYLFTFRGETGAFHCRKTNDYCSTVIENRSLFAIRFPFFCVILFYFIRLKCNAGKGFRRLFVGWLKL